MELESELDNLRQMVVKRDLEKTNLLAPKQGNTIPKISEDDLVTATSKCTVSEDKGCQTDADPLNLISARVPSGINAHQYIALADERHVRRLFLYKMQEEARWAATLLEERREKSAMKDLIEKLECLVELKELEKFEVEEVNEISSIFSLAKLKDNFFRLFMFSGQFFGH